MAAKTIGIEIRSDAVHLALVSGGHILSGCSAPLPSGLVRQGRVTDPEALSRIILALRKEHHIRPYPCILVLPRELVSTRRLTLPRMDHKKRMLNLPFEFQNCREDLVYGYALPPHGEDTPIFAAAASASEVRPYAALLRQAGLSLRTAIPEETAWQNLLRGKPLPAAFAILDESEDQPRIHFFSGEVCQMTRELDISQSSLPLEIRKAVNFYNYTLPVDAPTVTRLYCREMLSELQPGLEVLSLREFSGEVPPACLLAAGGGMHALSRKASTIDLYREEIPFRPKAVLPAALLLCVALLSFAKWGILEPLDARAQASTALAVKQEQLAQAARRLAQWDALEQTYIRWGQSLLRPEEQALVSRTDILSLIRSAIAPHADIADLTVNANALTMHLNGITLEEASLLMESLESGPLVSQAAVVSASAEDAAQANILISITLSREDVK